MMINTIFQNRYQVQEILSQKTGRSTLLALNLETQKLVIVKLLVFNNQFTWDDLKLFEREAQTLKLLKHSAIPQYLDYFEFDLPELKGFALVQTHINALNLEKCFQDGRRFTELELKELTNKLLNILTYLHEHNPPIVHRDIKPSNILLTNRSGNSIGDIYLVDFGSVQTVVKQDEGTITIVGTSGYIPPEQFMGKAVPASDLYSLGMTLIYLATGIQTADLLEDNGQVKLNNIQLSKPLKKWLEKITHPYLNRRFTSAKIAQNALTSADGNMIYYAELKPKNTKIQLHCEGEQLQIILPYTVKQFFLTIVWIICLSFLPALFYSMFFHFLTMMAIVVINLELNLNLSLDLSYLITCIIAMVVGFFNRFNPDDKKVARITINNEKIKAYNVFKRGILTNPCSEISLLGYSPSYEFDKFLDSTGKQENRGKVITESELFIYAGSNKYSIKGLTDAEYLWLGKELSEFLDLELQIIYPTPKVPPVDGLMLDNI